MSERTLRKKDRRWLASIAQMSAGIYPGESLKHVPESVMDRLLKLGYVEIHVPDNGAHYDRVIATEAGRMALEQTDEQ